MIVATRQMTVTRPLMVLNTVPLHVVVLPITADPPLCLIPPDLTPVLPIIATAMPTHHLRSVILLMESYHTRAKKPSLTQQLIYLSVLTRKVDS